MISITSKRGFWLALICASTSLILACNAVGSLTGNASPTPTVDLPEATPTSTSPPPSQGMEVTEPPTEPDACPDGPAVFGLQANHHFWTDTGMGDWVWDASGYLQVRLDEDGQVSDNTAQIIPGSQSGAFSDGENSCTFEAPAEVHINVHGSCVGSVLSLEIWEDWQMGTYDWTCDEDTFQFDLPDTMLPPSVHPVEYILGSQETYTFEIPFGGGSGTKVYTLVP